MLRQRYFSLVVLLTAISPLPGLAAEDWNLCQVPSFTFVEANDLAAGETRVEAQTVLSEDSESVQLVGNVNVVRTQQKVIADEVRISKSTQQIDATGNVIFEDRNYRLESPGIKIDNQNDRGLFEQPEFILHGRHARGHADEIEKFDQYRSRFENLSYTACDPDDKDWHLRARTLNIDDETGRGSAAHTLLYFKEIPFLYLPYFQFPIDDRRMSGLLAPGIGYSESRGTNITLPVYWNIAANFDMTITPAWYSQRGLQLNTENRYLFNSHRGQIDLSYLEDEEIDDSRWFQQWRHSAKLANKIQANMLLAEVSDSEFFDDFGSLAPQYKDTRHLERYVSFARTDGAWESMLLWQNYQTLDTSTAIRNRPYNRLPRLTLDGEPETPLEDLRIPINLEWVSFDREEGITGERSHAVTALNWRSYDSWYFFEPELQFAFTDYQLDGNPGNNSIYRALPTLSIDSGLIFERLAGTRNQWLQTFEPRLYFLHTPFEDQDEIPDFDTSLNSSTYSNLFRNNRFTGADRIGDADQVTLGLASRVYDGDSGDELLHARLGQIFYFEDRRVSLNGSRDEEPKSDIIAELDMWPNSRLKIAARLVYDQVQKEINDKDLSIGYSGDGYAANLGYYFTDEKLEQALVSMVYPVNERWTIVAKYHHSLLFDQVVENLLGFNYESCCWGLKILAGQTGDEIDDFAETDNSIFFEITLKGLSQAGRDIDARLREAIPGYSSSF